MDNFNLKKYLAEGILLKEKHSVIPNLERYIQLTDPSAELDDNDYAEKEAIELQAKQDGTLDDLERAASINHWGRYEPQGYDNLAFRQSQQKSTPNRITKSGKLNQNSATQLKNDIRLDRSIKEEQKSVVNNSYVIKDEEESDEDFDFYVIDKNKALEYLKQFNNREVDAETFINDDEGWGEFEQYLEDINQMSDKELEDAMRQELSYYFFSEPDEI